MKEDCRLWDYQCLLTDVLAATSYNIIYQGINIVNWINPNKAFKSRSITGPAGGIRGKDHKLLRQLVRECSHREFFLSNRVLPQWNHLPSDVINAKNTNLFKNKLDKIIKLNPNFI